MQASNCDRCYRRKGRCDKQQPCGSCARANVSCSYTDKVRQRRFTSDDVERVEKRLRQFYEPMQEISQFYNTFQSASAALEKISGVLEEKPGVPDPTAPIERRTVRFCFAKKDETLRLA